MIIDDLLSDLQKKCNNDNIYRGIEVTLNEKGMKIVLSFLEVKI